MSHHHESFPGTVTLRPATFVAVMRDVASSLSKAGFTHVLFINGECARVLDRLRPAPAVANERVGRSARRCAAVWAISRGIGTLPFPPRAVSSRPVPCLALRTRRSCCTQGCIARACEDWLGVVPSVLKVAGNGAPCSNCLGPPPFPTFQPRTDGRTDGRKQDTAATSAPPSRRLPTSLRDKKMETSAAATAGLG